MNKTDSKSEALFLRVQNNLAQISEQQRKHAEWQRREDERAAGFRRKTDAEIAKLRREIKAEEKARKQQAATEEKTRKLQAAAEEKTRKLQADAEGKTREKEAATRKRQADAEEKTRKEEDATRKLQADAEEKTREKEDATRKAKADAEEAERWKKSKEELAAIEKLLRSVSQEWGNFNNHEGEQAEEEFAAALGECMEVGGLRLDEVRRRMKNKYEYDLVGFNGNAVVVGEIKKSMHAEDVRRFAADRLPHFAEDFPIGRRRVYGMVGGVRMMPAAERAAAKLGLFVLRLKNKKLVVKHAESAHPIG